MTALMTLRIAIAVAAVALSLLYWIVVGGRGHEAFRRRCERRFRVIIETNGEGYWSVRNGGPWYRDFAIEWLQLGFFMALFLGWAVMLVALLLLGKLAGGLLS